MPGLSGTQEIVLETPFGAPSDAYVLGTLEEQVCFLGATWTRATAFSPSELNFRANIHGSNSSESSEYFLFRRRLAQRKTQAARIPDPRPIRDRTRHRVDTFFGMCVAHVAFADPVCPQLSEAVAAPARKPRS